jgi:hypothetical protein
MGSQLLKVISKRQASNGGFGLWWGADLYISAHVAHCIAVCKRSGITTLSSPIKSWVSKLEKYVNDRTVLTTVGS